MKYPISKNSFLSIQNVLYDKLNEVLKENIIQNINIKIDRDLLYIPPKNITDKRLYTLNVREWLNELISFTKYMFEELLFCVAYDRTYKMFDSNLKAKIRFDYRQHYLRVVLYDLYTFREKVAYLIDELFNRQINVRKTKEVRKICFNSISIGLKDIDIHEKSIDWIDENELKIIKEIMTTFSENKHIKNAIEVRNKFTHRSNPGIDALPLMSFERETIKYSAIVRKPISNKFENEDTLNEVINYDDIIIDVIGSWKVLTGGLSDLIKNVKMLKEE